MERILDRMKKSPLVFDGAMGTMIYERGVFINTCFDELSLSNPKLISQIHREYMEAGGMKAGPIARVLSAYRKGDFDESICVTGPAEVFDALQWVNPQVAKPVV